MTKPKYLIVVLAFLTSALISTSNIGACSPINETDPKEIVINAYHNLEKLKNLHVTYVSSASFSLPNVNMKFSVNSDSDIHLKPKLIKDIKTFSLTINNIPLPNNQKTVQYIKNTGNQITIYTNKSDHWVKTAVTNYADPFTEYDNYFKKIKNAILIEDLDDTSVYEVTIDGKYLKQEMEHALNSAASLGMLPSKELIGNFGDLKFKATVNKKTSTVSKIEMNLNNLFSTVLNNINESENIPEKQKKILKENLKNINLDNTITFSQLNTVANISIPQEALNAKAEIIGFVYVNKLIEESPLLKADKDLLNLKIQVVLEQFKKDAPNLTAETLNQRKESAYEELVKDKLAFDNEVIGIIKKAVALETKEKGLDRVLYGYNDNIPVPSGCIDVTSDVLSKIQ